jgi:hypothetical protein
VSVYPRQPSRQPRPERSNRDPTTDQVEEPTTGGCTRFILFGLLLLAVVVLCATGFFLARILLRDSSPATLPALIAGASPSFATSPSPVTGTPGQVQVSIDPAQGYINTLVTVAGQGWWPGEPVFVFLRSQSEADGAGYAYAAAVADDRGSFQTAFTFPNELRWIGERRRSPGAAGPGWRPAHASP